MDSAWVGLIGTAVGGAVGVAGTLGVEWLRQRSDERKVRRNNIYEVQNALDPLLASYRGELLARWNRGQPDPATKLARPSAIIRLNIASNRVGDRQLGMLLGTITDRLAASIRATTDEAAWAEFNSAIDQIQPLLRRTGELLHTNEKVDLS
jgi:hypothetical protein